MKANIIHHGDCLEILRSLPSDSVDFTFADPPFNLNKKYNNYNDRKSLDAYLEWCRKWLTEMVRITKPTGSIFVHNIPKWLTYYAAFLNEIAYFKHWVSWDAMSTPLGKTLMPTHYGILYYAKDKNLNKFYEVRYPHKRCRKCNVLLKDYGGKKAGLHPFGPLVSDVWTDLHRIKHAKNRDEHPCQLPETVLERLILMATDEGDIVLDPFNGTGTTVIAAKRLGRKYIGIELDKNYVAIAEEKLKNVRSDSKIGGIWVSKYLNGIATIRDKDWDSLKEHYYIPNPIPVIEYENIVYKNGTLRNNKSIPKDVGQNLVLPFDDIALGQRLSAKGTHN
ncbi:MAG: DNA methyltransferase [Thermodesulfobacteriota bacterium]|nr:DNA methyltransferase [Thermodesulfobacteriota bacterium]